MKTAKITLLGLLILYSNASLAECDPLLEFDTTKLHSSESVNFCDKFKDKTLLVVNTASQCGFTPQFKQLEALYQKYKNQGLEIIGFPSNDFLQEHSEESDTADVCYINYGVSFTMVSTSSVKNQNANLFFKKLIQKTGKKPTWNFNKYLVAPDAQTVHHYGSTKNPLGGVLESDIQSFLALK